MSLRPGARWSPQTQGIAGGIGSAFAGVSDQIRRVMQNRQPPPVVSGSESAQPGFAQSPTIALSGGYAAWSIPSVAVEGRTVMAVSYLVRGVSGTDVWGYGTSAASAPATLNSDGDDSRQWVIPAAAGTVAVATSGSGGTVTFTVLAW